MKDNIFIDSSVIISLLEVESDFHTKARTLISNIYFDAVCLISPYVINEIHYFYHRKYDLKVARDTILQLSKLEFGLIDFVFDYEDIRNIMLISFELKLRAFDSYHAYYCKKLKIKKIATFDDDFKRIPWLKIYE